MNLISMLIVTFYVNSQRKYIGFFAKIHIFVNLFVLKAFAEISATANPNLLLLRPPQQY